MLTESLLAGDLQTIGSLQPAATSLSWIDQGDHYWSGDEKLQLYRATNEITVNLRAGASETQLLEEFLSANTSQATIEFEKWLDADELTISVDGSLSEIEGILRSLPDVDWVAPSFINGESGERQWMTDEVVVALEPGIDPAAFFATDTFTGYRPLLGTADQFIGTVAAGGLATLDVASALRADSRVAWTSPDFFSDIQKTAIPNDGLFGTQWHLRNTGQGGAQSGADANLATAWNTTTGSNAVVIAVIDDGVQMNHPDLAANIFINADEIPSNGIDDDADGWIDDVNGWDFFNSDTDPSPAVAGDNHGTAVAGVASAAGNNSLGVSGASQNSKIMPLKIFQNTSVVSDATIAQAVYYAAGRTANGLGTWRGADVINCSWGGGSPNATLTAAFNWASVNGRGGQGTPIFVSSANGASGYSYYPIGVPVGSWIFEWRYAKDSSVSSGSDTAWLANVRLPNGTVERFDSPGLPAGWSTSGNASWSVVDDPSHAYGTGRYEAKAGTIGNSQITTLRSPTVVVSSASSLTFNYWISSEAGYDGLGLYASSNGGSSFTGPYLNISGVPTIVSSVAYPASLASTIAVGASTDWNYRSDYSQYGSALDFVASSSGGNQAIVTTDRTGANGYNTGSDYTTTGSDGFGGTSSAAPLASGVGALLLSKNPGLTASDVRTAMRSTAAKIGGNNGAAAYDINGFNQYYGYGQIDAGAAIASFAADTTGPTVSSTVLATDSGASSSDGISTDTTPVVTFTFNERTVWNGSDITVLAPDNSPIAPVSYRGTGTNTLTLVLPTLTQSGQYTVTLNGTTSFADQALNKLNGGSDQIYHFTLDTTPPIADIVDVAPDPRASAVGSISIVFDQQISGLDLADLALTHNSVPVSLMSGPTLNTSDGITWVLGNLSSLTGSVGNYVIALTAAGSSILDMAGNSLVMNASDTWDMVNGSTVADRNVFYNNSFYDDNANDPGNLNDDTAIATDKSAYLPGSGTSGFANYTTYDKGINGIMVDFTPGGNHAALTAADFTFKMSAQGLSGQSSDPTDGSWNTPVPAPTVIYRAAGTAVPVQLGYAGNVLPNDRIELVWADNAIKDRWLEVIVKANAITGLVAQDVFFYGNMPGDTNDDPSGDFKTIDANDQFNIKTAAADPNNTGLYFTYALSTAISNLWDINRDGDVNASDQFAAKQYSLSPYGQLDTINIPIGGPFAPSSGVGAAVASALANRSASTDSSTQSVLAWLPNRLVTESIGGSSSANYVSGLTGDLTSHREAIFTEPDPLVFSELSDELLESLLDNLQRG